MKKDKNASAAGAEKEKSKRTVRRVRRVLLWLLLVLVLTILVGIGIVAVAAGHLDLDEDMAVMEAMRGSRTTRIYYPENGEMRAALTAENYLPAEYDILFGDENMVWADSSEIPDDLKNAFVAIEDQRFYRHRGVDWRRTGKAVLNYLFRFEKQFGGSTITQQLVKNVHDERDISAMRKLKEMIRARRVEKEYTKDEILTYYLNIVPLGHKCTGVKSAARYYFGKDLGDLTPIECAALAAITNAPARYEPVDHAENNRARRALVLRAMYENEYLDWDTYEEATTADLMLDITDPVYTRTARGWYTDTVAEEVIRDLIAQRGLTRAAATTLVYRGGLEIYSLVDPTVEEVMEAYFADESNFTVDGETLQGGMVICDPYGGDLLGVVGGVGEKAGSRVFNRATGGFYQPGSALKPIALYAPALEENLITYATVFEDAPLPRPAGLWPHNSPNVYQGRIPLCEALARSKNTVAVKVLGMLGEREAFERLRRDFGFAGLIESENGKTDIGESPLALGQLTYGVSVEELTGAYTVLAAGGVRATPRSYVAVYDAKGELILRKEAEQVRIYSPETAFIMTKMLVGVVEEGTARSVTLKEIVETAGKTGTSGANRDKWFVGYTPQYVGGVRCGFDDASMTPAGTHCHLTAWDRVLSEIYRRKGYSDEDAAAFPMPDGVVVREFCRDSGGQPTDACRAELRGDRTRWGYFKVGYEPTHACENHIDAHFDLFTGEYGIGEGDSLTAVPFSVLYLPERALPEGVTTTDMPYEYGAIVRNAENPYGEESTGEGEDENTDEGTLPQENGG